MPNSKPLTQRTSELVERLFAPASQADARELLIQECGNRLPFAGNADARSLERVRFAALKLSDGDLAKLRDAVRHAQIDTRDVLVWAGFGDSLSAHDEWAGSVLDDAAPLTCAVDAKVDVGFAWQYRTDVATWNDPPATFALDGPFADGSRGTTAMPGQPEREWWIRDVVPRQAFAIETRLDGAVLRFEWTFHPIGVRATRLTQRVVLSGDGAAGYAPQIHAAFASGLRPGMERIAAQLEEAYQRAR